jgi:hypothetical protein
MPPTTTSTSTTAPPTSTIQPPPPDNRAPTVEIVSPAHLSSHQATFDAATQRFGAAVSLAATVSDPDGDTVTVDWVSSDQGSLGTGESIIATVYTGEFDAAQPHITARATDQWGATTEATIQIIVVIPSDT